MNERELSISLREMARSQNTPLCDEWYGAWLDDTDIDVLLDKYVRGIDFAIKNNYPPLEFIRKNFKKEDLHRHNIYLDDEMDIDAVNGIYVFLGGCKCNISFGFYGAGAVYALHDSMINVSASGVAKVFVSMYDHSHVVLGDCQPSATVKLYDRKKEP